MIEVAAAAVGAVITISAMGFGASSRRATEGRDAVIRLTAAVENVSVRLDEIHVDLRADRKETYARLNNLEVRVTKIEAAQ